MESIKFFITHSFLLHLLLAFLSFLSGLAMGWWIWSKFEDQARETERLLVAERERSAKLTREKQEWAQSQSLLQRRISELEAAHAGFTTDQSAWIETKARLELEIRDGRKLTETIENELSSCREERHQLIQNQRETESRLEKTDQSLNALRQQLAVALNDREVLTKARADLQQQVTQSTAEIRSLRQQLESISEARASAESNHTSLQASITKLETELTTTRPQITSLKQKIEELSQEREQHLQARKELEAHQELLEQEVVRLKTLALSQTKEKEAAAKAHADLEAQWKKAEEQIAELIARASKNDVTERNTEIKRGNKGTEVSNASKEADAEEEQEKEKEEEEEVVEKAKAAPQKVSENPTPTITPIPTSSASNQKDTVEDEADVLPLFAMNSRTEPASSGSAAQDRENEKKLENMRQDPNLGWVYTSAPATRDDLGELWGVADVIVEKLNACGVFTFRQIALWDDRMIEAFSERLDVFPERVRRDDWVNQAKDLHFRKYGERV